MHCSIDFDTLGKRPEGPRVKGVIHWVSVTEAKEITVRLYDRLFLNEDPAPKSVEEVFEGINPDSLVQREGCVLEPGAFGEAAGDHFQFERIGYFFRDREAQAGAGAVFNRTISLRGAWAAGAAR